MKSTILTFSLVATAALATKSQAGEQHTYTTEQRFTEMVESINFYNAHEFQIDVFGTYTFADDFDSPVFRDEETPGGGVGINYFFTRHVGVGLEGMLFDTDGDTLGSTAANLFLRAPLGDSRFALYAFGGAGIMFNADDLNEEDFERARERAEHDREPSSRDDVLFEAHVGVGAEFRFNEHVGFFTDVRRTFIDRDNSDYTSMRAGLRFSF